MTLIERDLIERVARDLYGGDDWDQRDTWGPGIADDWMARAEKAIRVVRQHDRGAVAVEDVERLLRETSSHFAGDHLNADVVVDEMRKRLRALTGQ